jgi:hypothetical protein
LVVPRWAAAAAGIGVVLWLLALLALATHSTADHFHLRQRGAATNKAGTSARGSPTAPTSCSASRPGG